jgi:hypothetical protein
MMTISPEVAEGSMLRVVSSSSVVRRLAELVHEAGQAGAAWWVEVTRQLDDLADAIESAPGDLLDAAGFTEQIRADAPHLMGRWERMSGEREGLIAAVADVRMLAGHSAGDASLVAPVTHAIQDLLQRVRRFQQRTTEVLLDAYERDLGGE